MKFWMSSTVMELTVSTSLRKVSTPLESVPTIASAHSSFFSMASALFFTMYSLMADSSSEVTVEVMALTISWMA